MTPPGQLQLPTPYDPAGIPRMAPFIDKGASVQAVTGPGLITAIMFANRSATTSAAIELLDGTDTSGAMIGCAAASAGNSQCFGPGFPGIPFKIGVYVHSIAGVWDLVIAWVPLLGYPY